LLDAYSYAYAYGQGFLGIYIGSVVWQSFICHRTGLTLRSLTQE
jgi:hypothetical protein